MLLSIFAIAVGFLVGRFRGGSWSGVTTARLHRPGFLVFGIFTMLVVNIIGPAFPLLWAVAGTASIIWFGIRNLQLTGMIVMLIGLLMNLTPLMANGAMPTSELALVSVGDVDDSGRAVIDGLRESTETATAFSAFGDVIPVPLFDTVVSIGDLVMLIALGDIVTNLLLRSRKRSPIEQTEAAESEVADSEQPAVLSPLNRSVKNRPAHAAHRRPRRGAAPSTHVPAHAKNPTDFFGLSPATEDDVLAASEGEADDMVIVLDGPTAYVDHGDPSSDDPVVEDHSGGEPDITETAQPWPDAGMTDLDEALLELESLSGVLAPAVPIPPTVIEEPTIVEASDDSDVEDTAATEATDIEDIDSDDTVAADPQDLDDIEEDATAEFDVREHFQNADAGDYDSGEDTARLERIEAVAQPEQQVIDLTEPAETPEDVAQTSIESVDNNTAPETTAPSTGTSTGSVDKNTVEAPEASQAMSTGSVDNNTVDKNTVDRRPIIDLTVSPTDDQLQEFLRRRAEADAELERRQNAPGPRPRGRAPRRGNKVADLTS